jgi:hypothetical protein
MKTKYIIFFAVIILAILFVFYLNLILSKLTEINLIIINLIDILNNNLMMNNISSGGQNVGNITGPTLDVESSSSTKISVNDKPQNVPLFKDLLTRSLPFEFVATAAHYDHLYETVYTTYETIKSEYPADKLTSKNLNMELIWRERFKLLVVTYDGDSTKIDQDLSSDIYTFREVCSQSIEFSPKLGAGSRWSNLSMGKSGSKVLEELWQRTTKFHNIAYGINDNN